MNSVDRHLDASSKAATLLSMRSAKKEIFVVVEGDTDVDVLANALKLPRSNILSCDGKETLMAVYQMAPQKGIDNGTVFLRDRDHDDICTGISSSVLLLVTNRYDLEMELLENRIFQRILSEFLRRTIDATKANSEFGKICAAAACIGALRVYSKANEGTNLDFDELKYNRFLDQKNLIANTEQAIRYVFAKSKTPIKNKNSVLSEVSSILKKQSASTLVCSKDFIDILQIALSRHYKACDSSECTPSIIARTLRISVVHDDLRALSIYPHLVDHVEKSEYTWTGSPL